MMIFRELQNMIGKERRRKERIKEAQRLALGVGIAAVVGLAAGILFAPKSGKETRKDLKEHAINTADAIKDTAQKTVAMVENSAAHVSQKVHDVVDNVNEKTEAVKGDIIDGYHEVAQDIHQTAEAISCDLRKPAK